METSWFCLKPFPIITCHIECADWLRVRFCLCAGEHHTESHKGKKPEVLSKFFILQNHDFTCVSQGHPSSNAKTLSHPPINSVVIYRKKILPIPYDNFLNNLNNMRTTEVQSHRPSQATGRGVRAEG